MKCKMKNIIDDADYYISNSEVEERRSTKKKGANSLPSMIEEFLLLEKEDIDHNKSSFSGQMVQSLVALAKY